MPPRFYVPEARATESVIELPQDEALHVVRVLRLSSGDPVRVFNGRGDEWQATVDQADRRRVTVRLSEAVVPVSEARVRIVLAVAVLKGDKMDMIVRDAVMLGVTEVQPLVTARTEITAAAFERGARIARWQRIAVSSAKQCGRAVVPEVRPAAPFVEMLRGKSTRVMLVEPAVNVAAIAIRELPPLNDLTVLVGPEGGWTDQEVSMAIESGTTLLRLGPRTLRADAVPIVALTALRVHWGDD